MYLADGVIGTNTFVYSTTLHASMSNPCGSFFYFASADVDADFNLLVGSDSGEPVGIQVLLSVTVTGGGSLPNGLAENGAEHGYELTVSDGASQVSLAETRTNFFDIPGFSHQWGETAPSMGQMLTTVGSVIGFSYHYGGFASPENGFQRVNGDMQVAIAVIDPSTECPGGRDITRCCGFER